MIDYLYSRLSPSLAHRLQRHFGCFRGIHAEFPEFCPCWYRS